MATITTTAFVNEQRKFPRYNIQIPASIRLKDGVQYQGKTNNISNNGAFMEYCGATNITKETHCVLTLFVEGKIRSEEIKIKCVLKPDRKGGIGLEFKTMSADDFINFISLLSSKTSDRDKYFTELKNNPGVDLVDEIKL
jgi:hypothetical protein